jgi:hypothetical protein
MSLPAHSARTVTGQERQQMVLFDLFAKSSAKYRYWRIPDDWNRRLCRENDSALLFDG